MNQDKHTPPTKTNTPPTKTNTPPTKTHTLDLSYTGNWKILSSEEGTVEALLGGGPNGKGLPDAAKEALGVHGKEVGVPKP